MRKLAMCLNLSETYQKHQYHCSLLMQGYQISWRVQTSLIVRQTWTFINFITRVYSLFYSSPKNWVLKSLMFRHLYSSVEAESVSSWFVVFPSYGEASAPPRHLHRLGPGQPVTWQNIQTRPSIPLVTSPPTPLTNTPHSNLQLYNIVTFEPMMPFQNSLAVKL